MRKYIKSIRPIMTYEIKMCAEMRKAQNMLRVAEMGTLRAIAVKTLKDKVLNVDIRQTCVIMDMDE